MSKLPLGAGCWFCREGGGDDMVFDREFDTPVHQSCILKTLEKNPNHDEARIMAYLLEPEPQYTDQENDDAVHEGTREAHQEARDGFDLD